MAGNFVVAAGTTEADYVARWDGPAWHALGSNGAGEGALDAGAEALAVVDESRCVATSAAAG